MEKVEIRRKKNERFQHRVQEQGYHTPYPYIPLPLDSEEELEINGNCYRWAEMVSMTDVLDNLRDNGASYVALEPIREKYTECFGDELCWTYPLSIDSHLGFVILLVREGVLCLPYDSADAETYEQFSLEAVNLLTAEKAQALVGPLLTRAMELYSVLLDVCRFLSLASSAHGSAVTGEVQ